MLKINVIYFQSFVQKFYNFGVAATKAGSRNGLKSISRVQADRCCMCTFQYCSAIASGLIKKSSGILSPKAFLALCLTMGTSTAPSTIM